MSDHTPIKFSVITEFALTADHARRLMLSIIAAKASDLSPADPTSLRTYVACLNDNCDERMQLILNNMVYSLYNQTKVTAGDTSSFVLDLMWLTLHQNIKGTDIKASFDVYLAHPFNEWKVQRTVNN